MSYHNPPQGYPRNDDVPPHGNSVQGYPPPDYHPTSLPSTGYQNMEEHPPSRYSVQANDRGYTPPAPLPPPTPARPPPLQDYAPPPPVYAPPPAVYAAPPKKNPPPAVYAAPQDTLPLTKPPPQLSNSQPIHFVTRPHPTSSEEITGGRFGCCSIL